MSIEKALEEKAEAHFDSIYTIHLNDNVKMPKTELYELMAGFAKSIFKEQRESDLKMIEGLKFNIAGNLSQKHFNGAMDAIITKLKEDV